MEILVLSIIFYFIAFLSVANQILSADSTNMLSVFVLVRAGGYIYNNINRTLDQRTYICCHSGIDYH